MKGKVKGIILIMTICLTIIFSGFIVISGRLPKFIKDRSFFKINYSRAPFDFRVDINDYSLYINEKVITNVRNSSAKWFNNLENNLYNSTSKAIDKTSQVFKNMEDKINNIIQNKVK